MMKLGAEVGVLYKNLGRVRIWGSYPLGAHPQKVALGNDVKMGKSAQVV